MQERQIRLRGVGVHNLKDLDVDLPRQQMIVVCGVSGSGKTSLALDTLYAEGQRRYIESFSAYTRQFLQRLDRPEAESIEGIPPAVAVTRGGASRSNRSTVATATETADYLRLLYAKIGRLYCYRCGQEVRALDPDSAARALAQLPAGTRIMVAFPMHFADAGDAAGAFGSLQRRGFLRVAIGERTFHLSGGDREALVAAVEGVGEGVAIVDRLRAGDDLTRLTESLEAAMVEGDGRAVVFLEPLAEAARLPEGLPVPADRRPEERTLDGRPWWRLVLSRQRTCETCGIEYPRPEPRLFSFNNPLGACPECEGFGDRVDIDLALVVPDPTKSLREGAIAPWNTPAYRHELEELLALADDYDLPVDVPFAQLTEAQRALVTGGVPERDFGGLDGFFAWLERKKYKMHIRVFLSRWRSYRRCPSCGGRRLRPEALAYRVGGVDLATLSAMPVDEAARFLPELELSEREAAIAGDVLAQTRARLAYLQSVGLGYLQLSRTLRTLSGGEAQRVGLTGALGSNLVNMLYVLDEPTAGLHPADVARLSEAVAALRNRGNTVVVVEHDETLIRAADSVLEIGPGAGASGGRIVFQGPPAEMLESDESLTGDFLAGRRGRLAVDRRVRPPRGAIKLTGARGNNLKGIDVEFPLGVLCLVTGVSGSGKSTLVQDTLYGALCRRKRKADATPLEYDEIIGDGQIDDCLLVDQAPISRSPRSNPVTYIKAFDAIRKVFAETLDARTHNYTASHFSFNAEGGRCETCQGDGHLQIDMQFLADVYMKCPACKGTRYRKEVLAVRYRDRNIAEVLEMTVRQAHGFFRGQEKVQSRLRRLSDVGLDYLRLGQPANTLSAGEAQRLKLAGFLASATRRRTLFLLDEPTVGLHFADIVQLLDCFDALLAGGHSLIVVEHNVQLMRAADYLIDLGPGAADAGGTVVAAGTPAEVAANPRSATGRVLAARHAALAS